MLGSVAVGASIVSPRPLILGRLLPDGPVFRVHAAIAGALSWSDRAPLTSVTQWERAASHATSESQVEMVANGIDAVRRQSSFDWALDDHLCASFRGGSAPLRRAILDAGLTCSDDPLQFGHVADGTPIAYTSRPPIGGVHYATWYPNYGLAPEPVPAGNWVHNLEHGAVVLLYRCSADCTDLEAALGQFYASLPRGKNERHSGPRLLITRYEDMDHAIAIVAWGHKLELDSLDAPRLSDFYGGFIDRGPECVNGNCPD